MQLRFFLISENIVNNNAFDENLLSNMELHWYEWVIQEMFYWK